MDAIDGPDRPDHGSDRVEGQHLRLASLVDSAQDAIMSAGLDGRIDSWNRAAERLFGYSAAEAIGQPASFLKPDALKGESGDKMARIRRGEAVPASDTIRQTKDGRTIEVSITHSAIHDAHGNLVGTSIVARDLTGQRRSEAAQFHLAAIIEHSGAAIIGSDLDGWVTSWNAAAEQLYGYTAGEAVGRFGSFLMPAGQEEDTKKLLRLQRGETVAPFDAVRQRKDGTTLDVLISPSIIRNAVGAIVGYSAFVYDITERKETERALEAAHEATLIASREYEAFAYAVAHDLRSPLRAIAGFTYLGQEQYEAGQPESGRSQLERARAGAAQMGRLIDSLLGLAQVSRQLLSYTTVDLSAIATSAVSRLREEFPNRIVETIVQPGITTTGDADLLAAVMTNLIANAWKFTRDQPEPRIEFGQEADQYLVRDNGVGFDMAHYDKLFGLFQRLHQANEFEGTGIGLATSQRIIRRHGGRIWADSAVGQGSTFRFTLQ